MRGTAAARVCALLALLVVGADDALGQRSYNFMSQVVDPDPRSQALGETGVLLRGAAGAARVNPAVIGRPHFVQVRGGTAPWVWRRTRLASSTVDYAADRWALAVQVHFFDYGEHERRDASNNVLGTDRYYDASVSLAAAYRVTPGFSVGLGLRYLRSDLGGEFDWESRTYDPGKTVTLDVGLHYGHAVGNDDVRVRGLAAWSLTNLGGTVALMRDAEHPLPTTVRGGLGVEVEIVRRWFDRPALRVGLYGAAARRMFPRPEVPVVYDGRDSFGQWQPIDVDITPGSGTPGSEADSPRVATWDRQLWQRGLELALLDVVAIRWGRCTKAEDLSGTDSESTFGWGVDLFYVAFDTSVAHAYDGAWRMSTLTVRVPLGGEPEGSFWPELIDRLGG